MIEIRYLEAAEEELLEAVCYLEEQAHGLGRRLLSEVKQAETFITDFPEGAREIRPAIRMIPLRKFRYSLVYTVDSHGILVLAVAHQSRRPGYWASRAK